MSARASRFGWPEHDVKAKKRVLRKVHGVDAFVITVLVRVFTALEHIPNSVRLWKETVNLGSSHNDARNPLSSGWVSPVWKHPNVQKLSSTKLAKPSEPATRSG